MLIYQLIIATAPRLQPKERNTLHYGKQVHRFVLASEDTESGKMPITEQFTEMHNFNKPANDAGLLVSSKGARLDFSKDAEPVVKPGPFGLENLVTGYWIVRFISIEEVVEWAKGIPFKKGSVQIRKIAGPEDFGDACVVHGPQEECLRALEVRR